MPYLDIDGAKYYYSIKNPQGEPAAAVVFVHGAGGDHTRWWLQVNDLGRRMTAVAVDLPGHGHSQGSCSQSIEGYSEFIRKFAEKLPGRRFFLAGHSMGGAVALDFALRYPDMLSGLILLGTGSRLRVMPALLETYRNGNRPSGIADGMYAPGTPQEVLTAAAREMESTDTKVFYSDFSACDNFDVSGRLAEINLPALVMTGDKDLMTPVKYGKFLAGNIKNAVFEIIEDAGHMLMLEQPGEVNSHIAKFIEKNL